MTQRHEDCLDTQGAPISDRHHPVIALRVEQRAGWDSIGTGPSNPSHWGPEHLGERSHPLSQLSLHFVHAAFSSASSRHCCNQIGLLSSFYREAGTSRAQKASNCGLCIVNKLRQSRNACHRVGSVWKLSSFSVFLGLVSVGRNTSAANVAPKHLKEVFKK